MAPDYEDRDRDHGRHDDKPFNPEQENIEIQRENVEIERNKWRGRRKMAWTALISMIVATALCMFFVPIERLKIIEELLSWYFLAMASVIGAYMGFTTWASITKK